eukprot:347567-Chlamydomonas_euryale.AAC.2
MPPGSAVPRSRRPAGSAKLSATHVRERVGCSVPPTDVRTGRYDTRCVIRLDALILTCLQPQPALPCAGFPSMARKDA